MRFVFLHALALLAALPAPAAWEIKPGTVSLALSPDVDSSLGIDFAPFADAVCGGASWPKGATGRINCGASIGSTKIDPIVGILQANEGTAALIPASLKITELELESQEPWKTPCGDFDFTMDLDPTVEQPVSKLILAPEGGAAHGVFSGFLEVALRLRFKAVDDGRIVNVPTRLHFPLAGPYVLEDPPQERGSQISSNVVLLARRDECFRARANFCSSWSHCCPSLCLSAPEPEEDIEKLRARLEPASCRGGRTGEESQAALHLPPVARWVNGSE